MQNPATAGTRVKVATGRDIPSLDGLRAASIAIVALSHTKDLLPPVVVNSGLFRYLIGGGLHGVQIFFVISGYLITTLCLREFDRTRHISLSRFYMRRMLRIFPPFYLYLGAVALLWAAGVRQEDFSTFASAATYTIIYHPHPQGWLVQHAWSLSIEEQFYLLWPVVLLITLRRNLATRAAAILLILMPIARMAILSIFKAHSADHNRAIVNSSAIDMLMLGCLLALLASKSEWRAWTARCINGWAAAAAALLGLLLVPYANAKLGSSPFAIESEAIGYSITALSIGVILEYLVTMPQSIAGRILNMGLVRHIGMVSYSIYLWQQLFTMPPMKFGLFTYPLILAAAELSFWLVERPLLRVRARFERKSPVNPKAQTQPA
jgi:peptidoglycan/LPS O-acetylase OafA/YrhL